MSGLSTCFVLVGVLGVGESGFEAVDLVSLPVGDAEDILLFEESEGVGNTPMAV